jgi:hypothetical protein
MPIVDEKMLIPLRVQVTAGQLSELKATATQEGIPLAALVRRLIDAGIGREGAHGQ